MSLPVNIDDYQRYLSYDSNELQEQNVPAHVIQRVARFRALYAYWMQFSSKSPKELVEYDMGMFKVAQSQAYDDIHVLKILVGNLQECSRKFARWRVNQMIEEDRKAAKRDGDHRAVASMQKNYILNNMTDKEETPDFAFEKIVPMVIEPTDDPSVLGIRKMPDLRKRIAKLIKKYSEDSDYVEIPTLQPETDNESASAT